MLDVLDYIHRIQKLLQSVGKFSRLICESPKKELFHRDLTKILLRF